MSSSHSPQTLQPLPSLPIPPPPPLPFIENSPLTDIKHSSTELQSQKKGIIHQNTILTAEKQAQKALQIFTKENGLTEDQCKDFVFISSYRPVKPIIQNGPLCGMVALAMAAELYGREISTEEIFEEAVRQGFSLQGEMFSANFMQELASIFLKKDVFCKNIDGVKMENLLLFIRALLENKVILFPYDADKNHGPCQAKGHKAHWALIAGLFIVFKKSKLDTHLSSILSSLRRDKDVDNLYYWDQCVTDSLTENDLDAFVNRKENLKLFTHQGKSKYCGIWDVDAMLESNRNLVEIGPDRNNLEYLIPDGGIQTGLSCKAVFIS